MSLFFSQIFTLLTVPPGNLIYHIFLGFSIIGALQGAIHHWRTSGFPQARRTVVGLAVLLGLQLVLFFMGLLGWQGMLKSSMLLPSLDRVVSFLSLVWIAWLWAFPEPVRLADLASLLLSVFGIVLFGLTTIINLQGSAGSFNTSIYELIWQVFSLGVAFLGIMILILRQPNGWGNGLVVFILAFLGHLVSLFWHAQGDYPGILRWAQMAMFPILLTLGQRFIFPIEQDRRKLVKPDDKNGKKDRQERRRYSTDPKTFHSLLSVAAETSSEKIIQNLTRGIAQAMLADLTIFIALGKENTLSIVCGYDLIREESILGMGVDKETIPLLFNAISHGRPLRLPVSSTSADLHSLARLLGLNNAGNLLEIPVTSPERGPVGGILTMSPYSNRLWTAEDQVYLSKVSSLLLPVIERYEHLALLEQESQNARLEMQSAREEASELKRKSEDSARETESLHEMIASSKLQAEKMAGIVVLQEEAQKKIDELQSEIERLRNSGSGLSGSSEQIERELRQTLEEMARLQNSLADNNKKTMESESRTDPSMTNEHVEAVAALSQELSQPMSSIVGYTDLLLGESVGILSSLQRKYVERIKASTERIGGLVENLNQITNLESGQIVLNPEPIDLNLIIDNAMASTSMQIREKNITLRLDIPDTTRQVKTDRDALQKILIHLLQNATGISPVEGTITLRVQLKQEEAKNVLAVQVVDTGGGIAAEDLPRVFTHRDRAEHGQIQGLGETGVGLLIAKKLVEAQGGRMWVDTEVNSGSTFSVVLPVELEG